MALLKYIKRRQRWSHTGHLRAEGGHRRPGQPRRRWCDDLTQNLSLESF